MVCMRLSPRGASESAELQHTDVQQQQQQQQQEFGQPGHSQEQRHAQRSQHAAQQGVLRSFTRQLGHGAVQPCGCVDDHDGARGVSRPEPRHAAHLTHTHTHTHTHTYTHTHRERERERRGLTCLIPNFSQT